MKQKEVSPRLTQYEGKPNPTIQEDAPVLISSRYRLTLVAFIFIPLSFTTSFFGMNIEQLGTGTTHIKFFFLLAILAGGIALLLSLCLKPGGSIWLGARPIHFLRLLREQSRLNEIENLMVSLWEEKARNETT